MRLPRYPIYIPSKGRASKLDTARLFDRDGVPYFVVVEPQEVDRYAEKVPRERLLVLPENDRGLTFARNWIKDHTVAAGDARHWQFDDDIRSIGRMYKRYRLNAHSGLVLAMIEDFIERYENVALASMNHMGFLPPQMAVPPFYLNARCYTCFLMDNSLPNRWRDNYNEDTDMSLQVLADGYCTMLFNFFYMQTGPTNYGGKITKAKGGQDATYADDGRLKMARALERLWPRIVTTGRKWGRPQHRVHSNWKKFDNKLIRRSDIDWERLEREGNHEAGMRLVQVTEEIKSTKLRELYEGYREEC